MLLYEHPLSSYAQKVKIALREKGLAFDVETPAALGSGTAGGAFAAASPRNEAPALIDGAARIFDSTIILEYLEDKYPSPPLLPRDPVARANARMIEDVCDTLYEAVNWGLGEIRWFKRADGEQAETMRQTAARQTVELQDWLAGKLDNRPWFNGEAFGWADASVAPYLNRSVHYGLGPPPGSPLARWRERLMERPSVAATFKEFEAAAQGMSAAAERLASGQIRREYRDHRLEMDDEIGWRADRARRHDQAEHPLHLAAGIVRLPCGDRARAGTVYRKAGTMTAKLAWDYRIAAAFVGTALVALSAAAHAQQAEHPQLKVARADILRLVPDATITRLTRRGCSEDANARCMVCAVAAIKGQERTGIVVVRQGSVEDNTFDPRQPSTKDAEAGIQAVCK